MIIEEGKQKSFLSGINRLAFGGRNKQTNKQTKPEIVNKYIMVL